MASGVWQLAQAHAIMQLEHLASRTYSGFRHSTRSTRSTFHSLSHLYAKGTKLAGLIWFVDVKSIALLFHTTPFNSLNWINESTLEILIQYLLPLGQILPCIIFPESISGGRFLFLVFFSALKGLYQNYKEFFFILLEGQ